MNIFSAIASSWKNSLPQRVLLILCVLGIVARFSCIERKEFWIDEADLLSVSSGHLPNDVFANKLTTAGELRQLIVPQPNVQLRDVLKANATREPVHPPLFYSLGYEVLTHAGRPELYLRLISAIASTIELFAVYGFTLLLFRSTLMASLTAALFALSPLHVMYAQEARPYALYMMFSFWAGVMLLKWSVRNDKATWITYLLCLLGSWYTSLHTFFTVVSHCIWLAVKKLKAQPSVFLWGLGANVIAALAFLPWALVIRHASARVQEQLKWLSAPVPIMDRIYGIVHTIVVSVYDPTVYSMMRFEREPLPYLFVLAIMVIAVVQLFRRRTDVKILVALPIILVPLSLIAQDLIFGGGRIRIPRYQLISISMMLIALANLFYSMLRCRSAVRQSGAFLGLVFIFGMEIYSCVQYLHETVWHDKIEQGIRLTRSAGEINRRHLTVVIEPGDRWMGILDLALLRYVAPDIPVLALRDAHKEAMPQQDHFLLFNPGDRLLDELRADRMNFRVRSVAPETGLYMVVRAPMPVTAPSVQGSGSAVPQPLVQDSGTVAPLSGAEPSVAPLPVAEPIVAPFSGAKPGVAPPPGPKPKLPPSVLSPKKPATPAASE